MSPFEIYLRTGRIVSAPEAKFNPWHDIEDGRFTFRNSGRHWGPGESANHSGEDRRGGGGGRGSGPKRGAGKFGGFGGGDFGGGGASGSWEGDGFNGFGGGGRGFDGGGASGSWDKPKPKPPHGSQPPQRRISHTPANSAQPHNRTRSRPLTEVRKNGYVYKLDDRQRPRDVGGTLQNMPGGRSRRTQLQAGGVDRRASDDGGHYIARRFNGPRDAFNHFAQDRNFNRGAYRAMEREWGMEIAAGRKVHVRIVPEYHGDSQRPFSIVVVSTIDGERVTRRFPNEPAGDRNER